MRRAPIVLVVLVTACRGETGGVDAPAAPVIDAEPGAPDAAPPDLPRHEAGPYKAYFGTLHDHHYGVNAGDDGGLLVGAPDEPGATGSAEWFNFRRNNPQYYVGGDAASAYAAAREAQLDFFALTPHNHLIDNEEYGAVQLAARDAEGIIALVGQEWSSVVSGNHATVMNVEARVTVPNGDFDSLLDTWLPGYIAGHPGAQETFAEKPFLILCHPALESWDYGPDEKAALEYGIDDYPSLTAWATAMNQHARLVELVSGDEGDENGLPRVMELLNDGLRIGFSAGPDNHRQLWGRRNDNRVAVLADSYRKERIAEALHARRTYITEDQDLGAHLALVDGGGTVLAWPGSEIASPGGTLRFEVGLEDPTDAGETYRIEIRVDDAVGGNVAAVVSTGASVGQGTHIVTTPAPPAGGYVVIHVISGDGDDLWFSPIWID